MENYNLERWAPYIASVLAAAIIITGAIKGYKEIEKKVSEKTRVSLFSALENKVEERK